MSDNRRIRRARSRAHLSISAVGQYRWLLVEHMRRWGERHRLRF